MTAITERINNYIRSIEEENQRDYSLIAELSIQYIGKQLVQVKKQYEYKDNLLLEDEIYYFKHIKTHLIALMQYYVMVQKIELQKPPKNKKKLKKFYLRKLHKIKTKFLCHRPWYNYYKSNSCNMDEHFFTRQPEDGFILLNDRIYEIHKDSTTSYVYVFAQIEAYEMLRHYLKRKIKKFDKTTIPAQKSLTPSKLRWTRTKADLTELIYSLYSSKVFNHGRVDLKEIAQCLQEIFHIDLGDYHRTFHDIQSRKRQKTKFLNQLADELHSKIEKADNQLPLY